MRILQVFFIPTISFVCWVIMNNLFICFIALIGHMIIAEIKFLFTACTFTPYLHWTLNNCKITGLSSLQRGPYLLLWWSYWDKILEYQEWWLCWGLKGEMPPFSLNINLKLIATFSIKHTNAGLFFILIGWRYSDQISTFRNASFCCSW